ncbi:MAG TPA: hypothetical protein VEP89_06815 [Draconibacterium sp.]|nr:hypothetical protein [Draconibacterium sp.]
MKTISFVLVVMFLTIWNTTEAQFLKKLKEQAQNAAERTLLDKTDEKVSEETEKAIDGLVNNGKPAEKPESFANPSKEIHTDKKRAFYTHDIIVKTFDKEKQAYTTSYFDANEIAMQSNWDDPNTGKPKTSYVDSEGYFISYNESKGRFEKSNLLSSGVMAMMAPNIMISGYKLPPGPFWETSEKLDEQGLNLNTFMFIEFAFIYQPNHFRQEMNAANYTESKISCRGTPDCTKFNVEENGYEGSYILFDEQDRLAEINIIVKDDAALGSGEGKLEFFYEPCEVSLPAATEIKQPGQELFLKGLDPGNN